MEAFTDEPFSRRITQLDSDPADRITNTETTIRVETPGYYAVTRGIQIELRQRGGATGSDTWKEPEHIHLFDHELEPFAHALLRVIAQAREDGTVGVDA